MLSRSPALKSPTGYLDQKRKSIELLRNRLISGQTRIVEGKNRQFVGLTAKLDAMSPLKVLTRGYAMARTDGGEVIKSIRQVQPGDIIRVTLSDGNLSAAVTEKEENL